MAHEVRLGRPLFGDDHLGFYPHLARLPPGLMLDLGAAIGGYTRLMRRHSPQSRVLAFEPFPGNHEHFRRRIGNDPMVTLVPKAVADKAGRAHFRVSKTVDAKSGFWSDFRGSSSLGMLVDAPDSKTFEVEVVRLDDLIFEPVQFAKIDIQGAEEKALRGGERVWREHGVDAMAIEFTGKESGLLDLIFERGYAVFDGPYAIITSEKSDLSDWSVLRRASLSTGQEMVWAWPKRRPEHGADYIAFLRAQREKAGNCWTDLICLAPAAARTLLA